MTDIAPQLPALVRRQAGAALIAVNGQPPRPYRVGASLEGGLVLQAVSRRSARLGASMNGPATVELTLPESAPAPS